MNTLEYENFHEVKDHYENEFSYNTYLCSIPLDFPKVVLHWHNEMELIYVKRGCASISIDMQDYTVHAGSIAIILPAQLHGIMQNPSHTDTPLEYENIIFNLNMLIPAQGDDMTKNFFKKLLDVQYSSPAIISPNSEPARSAIAAIDRADKVCSSFPSQYNLSVRSCLYDFFFHLNPLIVKRGSNDRLNKASSYGMHVFNENLERIKTITKYIELNYHEPITIEKMADTCNISRSHFMKFFKNYMGTSFVNYLNDYRLLMAVRMLETSDAAITDIAGKCGFDNISYFNRIFKKKYHMTPRQIRSYSSSERP
ncbi:MAG: AraC family transcriptional regulator [Eubacteriales bacterium]|nr:AraC family transcriptional regulator [Eubacteriales bacterium]